MLLINDLHVFNEEWTGVWRVSHTVLILPLLNN
jgi:uncharacterized cupin superfamily protein